MLALMTVLAGLLITLSGATPQADALSPVNLAGQTVDPFSRGGAKLVVLVFVRTDCPVSNKYAPEIQRLQRAFAPSGVAFWLVYPDATESSDTIRRHLKEYGYRIDAARDAGHALVAKSQVRFTPEAALFTSEGRLLYHGRIDNRYVDLGKARPAPTSRDLETALRASLEGRPLPDASAPAAGCLIANLR